MTLPRLTWRMRGKQFSAIGPDGVPVGSVRPSGGSSHPVTWVTGERSGMAKSVDEAKRQLTETWQLSQVMAKGRSMIDQAEVIACLRKAVAAGFNFASPGSGPHGDAIRAAFPDSFVTEEDRMFAQNAFQGHEDKISFDDHPLSSEADDGTWVSAWVWVSKGWRR